MAQLPKGYWWEVTLLQRLNSVCLDLCKRRNLGPLISECVVLRFSEVSDDDAVRLLIGRSFDMWLKFFHASHEKDAEWKARAQGLKDRLASPTVKVKLSGMK